MSRFYTKKLYALTIGLVKPFLCTFATFTWILWNNFFVTIGALLILDGGCFKMQIFACWHEMNSENKIEGTKFTKYILRGSGTLL